MSIDEKVLHLKQDLFIDDSSFHSLNEAFKKHSAQHVEWAVVAAEAAREVSRLRLQLKVKAAEICDAVRKEHFERTGKPLAVSFDIKGEVMPLNPEWVELNQRISDAYEQLEVARAASDAFAERGYLLREVAKFNEAAMGPSQRYESQGDKLIREMKEVGG